MSNSKKVSDYIVKKFDLGKDFDISQDDRKDTLAYKKAILEQYYDLIKVEKNETEFIEIKVLDKDKFRAANIANSILYFIDSLNRQTFLNNHKKFLSHYKIMIENQSQNLDTLKSTNGSQSQIVSLQAISNYQELKETEASLAVLNDKISTIYIIEEASIPLKKAKPIRWLIVTLIVGGSMFVGFLTILTIEFYNEELKAILKSA